MQKKNAGEILEILYAGMSGHSRKREAGSQRLPISIDGEAGCEYAFDASICEIDGRKRVFMLGSLEGNRELMHADIAFVYGTVCSIQISEFYGKKREECDCSKVDLEDIPDDKLRSIILRPVLEQNKKYLIGSYRGKLFVRQGIDYINHMWVPSDVPVSGYCIDEAAYGEGSLEFLKSHVRGTLSRAFQESVLA